MTSAADVAPAAPSALCAVLDRLEASHGDDAPAAAAALQACAPRLAADADGARALLLAEHVALGHLGDAAALAALLAALPASLAQAEPTAGAVQRLRWALAVVSGTAAAPPPPDTMRWRALQNVVLALAARGRCAEAAALLAADEDAARAQGNSEAGQAYAASANNVAVALQTGGTPEAGTPDTTRGDARDTARDTLMLQAAAMARRAWGHAGNWRHVERAEYRLALCHAVVGQGAAAVQHARLCVAACEAAGAAADAVEHFFAHEALARAQHAAGDAAAALAARTRMAALLAQIDEAEGMRAWCAETLAAVAGQANATA